jgi:hypothetical protein
LRFCSDPQRVAELIGPQQAQAYMLWRQAVLEMGDVRPKFSSKPDSQLKLDAAQEWRALLQMYEFTRKDPLAMAVSVEVLRKMVTLRGLDPTLITGEMPESKPEPTVGFAFKGDDLNPLMPQFALTIDVLRQCGFDVNPQAIADAQAGAQNQMAAQVLMTQMEASNAEAGPGQKKPAQHGGTAEKQAPLSKHSVEQTGNRPGPSVQ